MSRSPASGWGIEGVRPLVYHSEMHDLRDELAGLVADVTATLEAMRLQGTIVLPVGDRIGASRSPEPEPPSPAAYSRGGADPGPARRFEPPRPEPRAAPIPPSRAEPRPVPAPTIAAPLPEPRPSPPLGSAPELVVRTVTTAPTPAPAPAPGEGAMFGGGFGAAPTGGGLLGAWGAKLAGPEDRLAKVVAELGPTCPACGEVTVTGVGGVRNGLVLLRTPCTAAEAVVLGNMLVRVVGVEPDDVWTAAPRACATCADAVKRQVEAIKPRVVLVLGEAAAAALGLSIGVWGSFGTIAAVATFHPAEMAADANRKRPAFAVLQEVAGRR